jgi:hypothetical protein
MASFLLLLVRLNLPEFFFVSPASASWPRRLSWLVVFYSF